MRSDPEIFHEVIPRFLKDGWQVVRGLIPRVVVALPNIL